MSLSSQWQYPRWHNQSDYDNGHFVVVVGHENGRVHYLDPFWSTEQEGRIWMSEVTFFAAWEQTRHFRVPRQGLRVASVS